MLAVKVGKELFALSTAKSICHTGRLPVPATVKSSAIIELLPAQPTAFDPQIPNPIPYGAPNPKEYTVLPVPRSEKSVLPRAAGTERQPIKGIVRNK
jgi:hypothetical protein